MNPFARATEALERLARVLDCPLAIVGGLAAIQFRASVTTTDIDIVVPRDRLEAILAEAPKQGFTVLRASPHGWHRLEFADPAGAVRIEVVPAGEKSPRDPDYAPSNPSPEELGVTSGLGYASFAGWVAMKLVANREKDRYHVIETLKQATPDEVAEAVVQLRTMHSSYLAEFERLLRSAEDESQENW